MKTVIKTPVILIFIFFAFPSCSTYVLFEKPAPPEISLSEPKNSIVFINNYDYTLSNASEEKERNVFRTGVKEVMEGLKISFKNDELIDFRVIDTLVRGKALKNFPEPISSDSVRNICKKNNSSLFLILETFNPEFDWETEVEEYEDGSKSRTNNFFLIVTAGLSLYSGDGDLIDRSMVTRSSLYKSRPSLTGIVAFTPSLAKAEDDVRILARIVGEDYVKKFYPGTTPVNRKIYSGNNFMYIATYCHAGDWDKALELLKPLAGSPDPKTARKAAHNLSVVYEALGNERESEYWFKKSAR